MKRFIEGQNRFQSTLLPENLDDYEHHFYPLSRTRILSVLFKKSLKEKLQQLFTENNLSLTHIGNSTIEIVNRMAKAKKTAPDFFIEIDKNLSIVVFQENGLPYYIRKFISENSEGLVNQITRTINFVKSSYDKTPSSYTIAVDRIHSDLDFQQIHDQLANEQIISQDNKDREELLFPGRKK